MTKQISSRLPYEVNLPTGWEYGRFRKLFSFGKGLSITKDDLVDEGIPVISYGQIHSKNNTGTAINDSLIRFVPNSYLLTDKQALVSQNDFIFADTSEDLVGIGNCAFVNTTDTMFAGYHSIIARPKDTNICSKYFAYLFLTNFWRDQVRAKAMGVKVFSISQKLLRETTVLIPPKYEQIAIATFLDIQCTKIDSIIADIEKQIELLQKYKKSLITEAVTKGLDRSVPMKDSKFDWIPQIPTTWSVDRLGNISNLRNGYVGPTKDILVDEGEPYIQSLHIKNGKIIFEDDFYVTATWGKHYPKIAKGDLLLVQTGEIGQIALVNEQFDGCNCHALIICTPDTTKIHPTYLLYYLMSSVGNSQLMIYQTGTTLKHLNSTKIKNSKVIIPPVENQKEIVEQLDAKTKQIDAIIETKQKQIDTMFSHKKSLIYEYVTGKKRVTREN